ncbi:MAG TPA: hypothetical protein ENO19_01085 [Halothiobacillaceae bacterium]|nr:hypothetical protein [Halothiobacillaceae bacterium]
MIEIEADVVVACLNALFEQRTKHFHPLSREHEAYAVWLPIIGKHFFWIAWDYDRREFRHVL